ncbi:hypothetical protein V1L54_05580 [Streptomyces sp. TRM 70361]|uniref:hypothetical protein n=1 Tax=Streptomyces sp. TRM 70361 TaxID=3116553 RepID=UPI002E7C0D30|nr:hypothetical protein [Streptomyces sp. TRM 70361]MEE1938888.1 hypothetical protein [Streptomyces sp. TRM 70361]
MKKSILAATAVLATTAGLAGCSNGGSGTEGSATKLQESSAQEITDKAAEATKALDSVRMTGQIYSGGERLQLDMALAKDGKCTGTISMGEGTAEVLNNGTASYMKGDEAFWQAQSKGEAEAGTFVEMLKGRWVKMGGEQGADAGFDSFCDLDKLLEDMDSDTSTKATKGELTEIEGRQAIPLVEEDGKETTTVYIANDDAEPYLLRMENEGSDEPGVMDLTDHNKPVEITEPPASEVLDLAELGAQ